MDRGRGDSCFLPRKRQMMEREEGEEKTDGERASWKRSETCSHKFGKRQNSSFYRAENRLSARSGSGRKTSTLAV